MRRGREPGARERLDDAQQPYWHIEPQPEERVELEFPGGRHQNQALYPLRVVEGVICDDCAAVRVPGQNEFFIYLEYLQRGFQVGLDAWHIVAAGRFVGKPMSTQVDGDDTIFLRQILELIMPLPRLPAEAMYENKSPLRPIR